MIDEAVSRQLPDFIGSQFKPCGDEAPPGSRFVDFDVTGPLNNPKSNLYNRVLGDPMKGFLHDLLTPKPKTPKDKSSRHHADTPAPGHGDARRYEHLISSARPFRVMALRVIAGSAGGMPLACPKGDKVRPTMDQVRGAIFSSLGERVPGARVLDLFAGTGGLGIEALSRGAVAATFIERDRRAIDCIRGNLEKTRLAAGAELICLDVFTFLGRAAGRRFDLDFRRSAVHDARATGGLRRPVAGK